MLYTKRLGVLWLAASSVALQEGTSAKRFEHTAAGSPALPPLHRGFS